MNKYWVFYDYFVHKISLMNVIYTSTVQTCTYVCEKHLEIKDHPLRCNKFLWKSQVHYNSERMLFSSSVNSHQSTELQNYGHTSWNLKWCSVLERSSHSSINQWEKELLLSNRINSQSSVFWITDYLPMLINNNLQSTRLLWYTGSSFNQ